MVVPAPVRRSLAVVGASFAIIVAARAQEKPAPPPLPQEAATLELGAKDLGAFASLAFKNGFPARAKVAWLEVIGEYAADDEAARKALGWYRHGAVWQRDPKFDYPEHDRLEPSVARMLEQRWSAIAAKLGAAHRTLAEQLSGAGAAERAKYHANRALRFTPTDAKAVAQSGLRQLEGITGDDVDLAVLQRSRRMDRTLGELAEQTFPAEVVDDKLDLLDKAGCAYVAVKSATFTVFGDHDPATLQLAATWAERALRFCQHAFEGVEGFPSRRPQTRKMVFLKDRASWELVIRKNVSSRDVEWLLANVRATEIGDVETAAAAEPELVYDLAVRWVAHDYSGLGADALQEGIGHAVVGMFFGRNLVFSVGQQQEQGTVAGPRESRKLMLPDMATWIELAIENAWQQGGTPAARLPLLKAAQFPTDARIKAWSFCDYLLRRDPALLLHLQRTAGKSGTEGDVLEDFHKRAGQSLLHVEDRWRRFWTEDSPLRRAVLGKTTPLEATSREAPAWLDLWNRLRHQHGLEPVGWSAALSVACKEHVDYLKANKDQRGPDEEHRQLAGKPGYSNAGRTFAPDAVVWTKDAKKAADTWLLLPGYRDAILDQDLATVGIYAEGGIVVVDGARGRDVEDKVATRTWPRAKSGSRVETPIVSAVDVDVYGSELQQLLAANGRAKQKQIGCPLTLHGYNADLGAVACKVTIQGAEVPGFLVRADRGSRRTAARGMYVFWPAEPWKRGADVHVQWTWRSGKESATFVAQ